MTADLDAILAEREQRRQAADWHQLPAGKYAHFPYIADDLDYDHADFCKVLGHPVYYRTVPRVTRAGRTIGREAFTRVTQLEPGATWEELERVLDFYGYSDREGQTRERQDHIADFLNDPDYYRALFGKRDGHCGICGRALSDPVSRERGIGPECAKDLAL